MRRARAGFPGLVGLLVLFAAAPSRGDALPAEPGRVWDPASELEPEKRSLLEEAVARAERISGERFLVVLSLPKSEAEPGLFIYDVKEEYGDRNVLFVLLNRPRVELRLTKTAEARVPRDLVQTWEGQIANELMSRDDLLTAVARVVRELGETLTGHPPKPWSAWRHPFQSMAGGQDAKPLPFLVRLAITLVALVVVGVFLILLITNPVGVLIWIGMSLIGGGGGGGGGGSSFSGGGGDSGGGGASGSW